MILTYSTPIWILIQYYRYMFVRKYSLDTKEWSYFAKWGFFKRYHKIHSSQSECVLWYFQNNPTFPSSLFYSSLLKTDFSIPQKEVLNYLSRQLNNLKKIIKTNSTSEFVTSLYLIKMNCKCHHLSPAELLVDFWRWLTLNFHWST